MNVDEQFKLVDEIIKSDSETKGVDAFVLSWVRAERQTRRIFTFIIFQSKSFSESDIPCLIDAMSSNTTLSMGHLLDGINQLLDCNVEGLFDKDEDYHTLFEKMKVAKHYRNKLLHGQLTNDSLTTEALAERSQDIQRWCKSLSKGACRVLNYDGFTKSSFHKAEGCISVIKCYIDSVDNYKNFLRLLDGNVMKVSKSVAHHKK